MEKKISILGSTGSIGRQTLNVAKHLGESVKVVGLAAKSNVDLIEAQAIETGAEIVCLFEEKAAKELKRRHPMWNVVSGIEGLCEVASYHSIDTVIVGVVGSMAILPVMEAIRAKKLIGLANKEVLVSAGEYITKLARENEVTLFPIDSEHSAIFQCLLGEKKEEVSRLILTASGGPFLHLSDEELKYVTAGSAANHPTWTMGGKVSIDCSTLMNKGFEVIEAKWLFDFPVEKIDVVIHPQSVVHSFVEFVDGSMKAQVNVPSMELPIQYALTYPERVARAEKPFDFQKYGKFEFYLPDLKKFRCLELAYESLRIGGSLPCVLNAGNEVLVERFCQGELSWLQIAEKLETLLGRHNVLHGTSVDTLLAVDREARLEAERL
jgi:1-deoxy-D-xylulose-5-phosphate reductoisomerase